VTELVTLRRIVFQRAGGERYAIECEPDRTFSLTSPDGQESGGLIAASDLRPGHSLGTCRDLVLSADTVQAEPLESPGPHRFELRLGVGTSPTPRVFRSVPPT
jgi:hypothetical protein